MSATENHNTKPLNDFLSAAPISFFVSHSFNALVICVTIVLILVCASARLIAQCKKYVTTKKHVINFIYPG